MNPNSIRPRLRKVVGKWECSDGIIVRAARTPRGAYERWLTAAIADAQPKRRGTAKVAAPPPVVLPTDPYKGEVQILKGVAARPSFKLPTLLQINAERARAAQQPMRSLAGIRDRAA